MSQKIVVDADGKRVVGHIAADVFERDNRYGSSVLGDRCLGLLVADANFVQGKEYDGETQERYRDDIEFVTCLDGDRLRMIDILFPFQAIGCHFESPGEQQGDRESDQQKKGDEGYWTAGLRDRHFFIWVVLIIRRSCPRMVNTKNNVYSKGENNEN